MYEFRLYVIGNTPSSKKAITKLESFLEDEFKGLYCLEIINLLENPQLADRDDIFATPTLVKTLPAPSKRILGDMANKEKVLAGLGLEKIESKPRGKPNAEDNK